jgi:hypothetical protein
MNKYRRIRNVFNWMVLVSIIGLLQVWLMMLKQLIYSEDIVLYKLISDGYFLFFMITILASFIVDELLRFDFVKQMDVLLFIVYPFIIILVSVSLHLSSQFSPKLVDVETVKSIHYSLYSMTLLYAITYKFRDFKKLEE